jgi:hypothetical protein
MPVAYFYGGSLDMPPVGSLRPCLESEYPSASVVWRDPAAAWSRTGRTPVGVGDPPPALLADWRFPKVPEGHPDPTSVEAYRAAVLAALALWRDGWAERVRYGGRSYTLRAGPDGQQNFTRYAVALREQIQAGVTAASDALPVQDAAGEVSLLPASGILRLLAVYSRAVMLRELQWNALAGAALAAQSAADLDAITWGD